MTEERSCKTCGLSSSNNVTVKLCRYFGVTCNDYNYFSKWQPIAQEKPMGKIQMTEYQARELFSDIGLGETVDMAIDESKKNGYIRKTALEEAEEMYHNLCKEDFEDETHVKQHEAIQELKKENVRLRNLIRYSRE